jgi:ketosteroid isomerase-like protein
MRVLFSTLMSSVLLCACAGPRSSQAAPAQPQAAPGSAEVTAEVVAAEVTAEVSAEPDPVASDEPTPLDVDPEVERAAIDTVVDDWHQAAAKADQERYLGHFTKDAVFLGTDAGERWPVFSDDPAASSFSAYVERHFPKGGWTYEPHSRQVSLSKDGHLAWFDELLTNAGYGELRGTGVLRREEGQWRLAHYSMTFTVPNGVSGQVVGAIKQWQATQERP